MYAFLNFRARFFVLPFCVFFCSFLFVVVCVVFLLLLIINCDFLFLCRRYLTLREQKLMKRRKEAENLLENKKKLLEWEKRLDKEESLVRNLLNEALNLESSRKQPRTTSITSEEEEHKGTT